MQHTTSPPHADFTPHASLWDCLKAQGTVLAVQQLAMLTHTDLLSLPASRELDALVAEKVFGAIRNPAKPTDGIPTHWVTPDGKVIAWIPDYSTAIAAAWEVVSLLRDKNPAWYLIMNDTGGGSYRARFFSHGKFDIDAWVTNPNDGKTVWADTAPLAICRAALKAVSAEIPIHSHGAIRSGRIGGTP